MLEKRGVLKRWCQKTGAYLKRGVSEKRYVLEKGCVGKEGLIRKGVC